MERFDIAIIGTGPAGLEASITAKLRNKNILLIGSNTLSSKINSAHTILNYLGFPDAHGDDLQKAFLEHIQKMNIQITSDRVISVYSMGKYFAIQGVTNNYEASTVILACGMSVAKPFDGEIENLGRGVSYCATCDAVLYKNKVAVVIAYSKKEEMEAEFLSETAEKVIYIPMYDGEINLNKKIMVMKRKKPIKIKRNAQKIELVFEDEIITSDGVFILRENIAPSQLVPGLETEDNHIRVDRMMRTNLNGLFAAGDITGLPYQFIKAAGEGNVAALSAVSYLAKE